MNSSISSPSEQPGSAAVLPPSWWPHLAAVALIIVELCWVVDWYRMVIQISVVASPARTAMVLGAVMLVAYGFAQILESLRLLRSVQLAAMVGLFIVSLLVSSQLLLNIHLSQSIRDLTHLIPGEVLVMLTVLWLWWRGVTLARQPVRPVTAWRRFELGLFLYLVYVFIAFRLRDVLRSEALSLGQFIFFLFMGLLAVVFARVSYVGIAHRVRKNPFDRRWLASVFLILGATVAFAAVVAGLLTGQYILLLELGVEALRLGLAVVVFLLSLPGLLLSTLFTPLLPWLRNVIAQRGLTFKIFQPEPIPIQPDMSQPLEISASVQVIIFWTIMGILLFLLFLRVRQRTGRGWRDIGEEPESLLHEGDLRRLLRKALDDAAAGVAARLRPARRILVAARIRRIYAQLLDLSAELNHPRLPSRTPLEFLLDLGELFPQHNQDLELITQAYLKVRYGELPETQAELAALDDAWSRVAVQGEKLKKAGQHKLKTADQQDWQRTGV